MKLSDLSIRRPVLASMVSLALVLFGAIGYTRLAVREFPDVDPPIVSVSTELPGANPQVVESAVTDILEEELSTVEGLRTLTSSSAEGFSNITLEFNLERGVEAAAQDVRDKVARIRGRLPRGHRGAGGRQAGGGRAAVLLARALGRELRPAPALRHRRPAGEGAAADAARAWARRRIFGERRFSMRVWLSAAELSARGLTVQDVQQAIRTPQRRGAGRADRVRPPRVHRALAGRAQDARRVRRAGGLERQRRAGQAQGPRRASSSAPRTSGARSGSRARRRSPSASSASRRPTSSRWPTRSGRSCPGFRQSLPPGVKLDIGVRRVDLRVALDPGGAGDAASSPALLVVIIIFVFLRNLRATIIPGLAIPASIVATFAIMYFLGFSINNFTLLALTLAIGIVVDDAIIVLENAYRHQEELGESPEDGRRQRHARDRLRRHRDHHLARRGVHAARVPQGLDRPAVQRVRHRRGGLGGRLGLRGADAHADALRQDPAGAQAARAALPRARERVQRPGGGLQPARSRARCATAGRSLGGAWCC